MSESPRWRRTINLLHERITQNEREIDQQLSGISGLLKSERQSREGDDQSIRAKLETTATGGIHISAIGTVWLFVGVILSTAAVEISCLLK
jgi:hypothetical protein